MKIKSLFILLIAMISFASCKKDALTVDSNKTYYQVGSESANTPEAYGGLILTLQPGGRADLLMFGDIMDAGTYQINGNKLTVTTPQGTLKFIVISNTELVYNNEVILRLKQ